MGILCEIREKLIQPGVKLWTRNEKHNDICIYLVNVHSTDFNVQIYATTNPGHCKNKW